MALSTGQLFEGIVMRLSEKQGGGAWAGWRPGLARPATGQGSA